jgi:DNA-binding MarR family transcriptional regulator
MSRDAPLDLPLGELLQDLINRIAHRRGELLRVFAEESVTLQQVLLLRQLQQLGDSTPSVLAGHMHMSLPAVSQMLDRLFVLKLLTRREAEDDRRRKQVALTARGREVLLRVRQARTAEYAAGLASLPRKLRAELADVLRRALEHLPDEPPPGSGDPGG